ncbi:MAG: ACP S-malonyltransferase [Pseudomonadota bacterium]
MYAFVFPGQGSQKVGVGSLLYQAFPCAKDVFDEVDEALKQNLSQIIFSGSESDLKQTQNTQPALMAVSMAVLRVLEVEGRLDLKQMSHCVAGHSLGEYSALTAARVLSLANTAKLLRIRGNAMRSAAPEGTGAMAAILGLETDVVADITKKAQQELGNEVCVIANDNSPGQIVISGHKAAVERAMELAKSRGCKRALLLPVSGPFHSPLMQPAADVMQDALEQVEFAKPLVSVVCNVTAKTETEPARLKENLVTQITGQVRWRESIQNLDVQHIIELGAGKVLTGLNKRINPNLTVLSIETPTDIEIFLKEAA